LAWMGHISQPWRASNWMRWPSFLQWQDRLSKCVRVCVCACVWVCVCVCVCVRVHKSVHLAACVHACTCFEGD
jgi:hypothetical protein